jgi:hypothetical protein
MRETRLQKCHHTIHHKNLKIVNSTTCAPVPRAGFLGEMALPRRPEDPNLGIVTRTFKHFIAKVLAILEVP